MPNETKTSGVYAQLVVAVILAILAAVSNFAAIPVLAWIARHDTLAATWDEDQFSEGAAIILVLFSTRLLPILYSLTLFAFVRPTTRRFGEGRGWHRGAWVVIGINIACVFFLVGAPDQPLFGSWDIFIWYAADLFKVAQLFLIGTAAGICACFFYARFLDARRNQELR
jgi:hypothetical protein